MSDELKLSLRAWSELVTRIVRARLPDVRAVRSGTRVSWSRGVRQATLDAAKPDLWWLRAGSLTYCEQPDAHHARVAASNIVCHFDLRWCRGIDHQPYSEVEMKRIEGEARPLRSTLGA